MLIISPAGEGGLTIGGGGAGTFSMLADLSGTSAPPQTSSVTWNNATQPSATQLFVHGTAEDGASIQSVLADVIEHGDKIRIRSLTDPDQYQLFAIKTITDNTTYVTYDVRFIRSNGSAFSDDDEILIVLADTSVDGDEDGFPEIFEFGLGGVTTALISGKKVTDAGGALNALGADSTSILSGAAAATNIASGARAIAIGKNPTASGIDCSSIGANSEATGLGSLAWGGGSATGARSISTGTIAIGAHDGTNAGAVASGVNAIAMGSGSSANTQGALAVGFLAVSSASGGAAFGWSALANGANGLALGRDSEAGSGAVSMGYLSGATGLNSLAAGRGAEAFATNSTALGTNAFNNVEDTWCVSGFGITPAAGTGINWTLLAGAQIVIASPKFDATVAVGGTQTSGTLVIGRVYEITTYVATDDFTNVGAGSNATGVAFIATGTTPTDYTNGSTLTYLGTVRLDLPANVHFYCDSVDIVATELTGAETVQGTYRAGNADELDTTGDTEFLFAAVAGSNLDTEFDRDEKEALLNTIGVTSLSGDITVASDAATSKSVRFIYKGVLLKDN